MSVPGGPSAPEAYGRRPILPPTEVRLPTPASELVYWHEHCGTWQELATGPDCITCDDDRRAELYDEPGNASRGRKRRMYVCRDGDKHAHYSTETGGLAPHYAWFTAEDWQLAHRLRCEAFVTAIGERCYNYREERGDLVCQECLPLMPEDYYEPQRRR